VLPEKETRGRAEAREASLYFSCGYHAIVRERHDTVAIRKAALAFWAFPRRSQVLGDNEVLGLQRVKHHNLREEANSDT
jgi:hypothetical protein